MKHPSISPKLSYSPNSPQFPANYPLTAFYIKSQISLKILNKSLEQYFSSYFPVLDSGIVLALVVFEQSVDQH